MKKLLTLLALLPGLAFGQGSTLPWNPGVPTGQVIGSYPQWVNFNGSGHIGLISPETNNPVGPTFNFKRATTGPNDAADFFVHRLANYASSPAALVNNALNATTIVSAGAGSYEWVSSFILDNFATFADGTQNVAEAAHATQEADGLTWARNAAAICMLQDNGGGCVGDELDIYANGTQANNNRVVFHIVAGNNSGGHDFSGNGAAHIRTGILLTPQNNDANTLIVDDAWIVAQGDYKLGMHFSGAPTQAGSALLTDDRTGANVAYGLNLGGTYSSGAIFLRDDKNVIWSGDQTVTSRYGSSNACLENRKSGTAWYYSCGDGTVGVGTVRPPVGVSAPAAFYVNKLSAPIPEFRWGIPVLLPSSGTFSTTPSAGGLTLTTAITNLTSFCSTTVGCYMYFPVNTISGANAAGVYFTTCTSTTVCSVFNNILSSGVPTTVSSPTSFGTVAGGGYTQTTAAELQLVSVSIPGNVIGLNGSMVLDAQYSRISNANTVVPQAVFSGQALVSVTTASTQWIGVHRTLHNQGAANSQFSQPGSGATDETTLNAAPVPITVDTTTAQNLVFRCQLSTAATDWCMLTAGNVTVNYAP